MKHLITLLIAIFAYLFVNPIVINAQNNTYTCMWVGGVCAINPARIECLPGYIAWNDCIGLPDSSSCQRSFNCRPAPNNTPPPVGVGSPICDDGNSINTPFGCLPFTGANGPARSMIQILLDWGIGLAAGISLLTLIYASFQIATAAGDAKRVQAGRELVTASIGGLILIVMGIVILNFLGVRLLGLGSLGFNI